MPSKQTYEPSAESLAVVKQLAAEMAASGISMKALAEQMGRDYSTARRWFIGERQIGLDELLAALSVLELDWRTFMARARERFDAQG